MRFLIITIQFTGEVTSAYGMKRMRRERFVLPTILAEVKLATDL